MKEFERTHPWLTFRVDLRRAPADLWLLLGEAAALCESLSGVPLRPATAERLHRMFLAKGVAATTAIEGNTLTEDEVARRIDGELRLPPSREYQGVEIDNIVREVRRIGGEMLRDSGAPLTFERILEFNREVLRGLRVDPEVVPGEIRRHSVVVGNYRGAPARDCADLVRRLAQWLEDPALDPWPTRPVEGAVLRAVLAHLYIAWIHPFGDGNGRTARLLEYRLLVAAGVPSPAAHLFSNHYNLTRPEYYRQLSAASASGGDVLPFLQYALQGFVDGLKEQAAIVRKEHQELAWRDFVRETLFPIDSPMNERRRSLVFALTSHREPVPRNRIDSLSTELTSAYAGKTAKTLTRDLNTLTKLRLIRRTVGGYEALTGRILQFVPPRVKRR
jgi:Fic family protein